MRAREVARWTCVLTRCGRVSESTLAALCSTEGIALCG